ncbi:hypothetical protein, partial [Brevibacillus sp. 179-C9.3 HS]|uniref:hypothetical protein n=1 Tax=unclassified Brevibacillus TaxID=2684853 RepID=UPI00399F0D0E
YHKYREDFKKLDKLLAGFLLFPLRAVEILHAFLRESRPLECRFHDVEQSCLGRRTFPVLAPLEPYLAEK